MDLLKAGHTENLGNVPTNLLSIVLWALPIVTHQIFNVIVILVTFVSGKLKKKNKPHRIQVDAVDAIRLRAS